MQCYQHQERRLRGLPDEGVGVRGYREGRCLCRLVVHWFHDDAPLQAEWGMPSLCGGNGAALCILPHHKMPPTQQSLQVPVRAPVDAVVYIGPSRPETPGRKRSQPIAIELPGRNLPKVYTPLSARGDLPGYVYLPPFPEPHS